MLLALNNSSQGSFIQLLTVIVLFVIVLAFSIILWFVSNFDFRLNYVPDNINVSILFGIAGYLQYIFAPLNFSVGCVVAMLFGIVAKEMVLSTILVLNGTDMAGLGATLTAGGVVCFDTATMFAFLVFVLLYTPCISALGQLKAILPTKKFFAYLMLQFVWTYLVAMLVKLCVNHIDIFACVLASLFAFLVVCSVLKRLFLGNNQKKLCNFCDKC